MPEIPTSTIAPRPAATGGAPDGTAAGRSPDESTVALVLFDLDSQMPAPSVVAAHLVARLPALNDRLTMVPVASLAETLDAGGRGLVILRAPADGFAAEIATQVDPADAVQVWLARSRSLLDLQHRCGDRLALVSVDLVTDGDETAWRALARRLDVPPPLPGPALPATAPRPMTDPSHLAAIADALRDPQVGDVLAALDAARLGQRKGDKTARLLAALDLWRSAQDETALLRESLEMHVAGLREATRAMTGSQLLNQAERTARAAQAKRARDDAAMRDAVVGAQIVTLDAHLMTEIETGNRLRADLANAQAERDQLATRVQALSNELNWVYGTRSWRITRPLRAIMGWVVRHRS